MSYLLHVLLRSAKPVTREEISGFIRDGVFFNGLVAFDPSKGEPEMREGEWRAMSIAYHPTKRPIIVRRLADAAAVSDEISEVLDEIDAVPSSPAKAEVVSRISATRQILTFGVHRDELPDEAWHMLDALEAWLAQTYSGLIWAEEDGVFDDRLQPVLKLG